MSAKRVRDLVDAMERIAPPSLAEEWDNVGLLAGDPEALLSRVLLCIDYTREVAEERRAGSYDAVVSYHPPIWKPLKRVVAGSPVFDAIRDGVALYSPHTALDVANEGTNDVLADALELETRGPLRPHASVPAMGIGRVGTRRLISRHELLERIKSTLSVTSLLVAGPSEGDVTRAACCAGSCGDCLNDAIAARADLYLTGELRHHDALRADEAKITIVCALHSNSERTTLARLRTKLENALPGVVVERSAKDRDPFRFV